MNRVLKFNYAFEFPQNGDYQLVILYL